MVDKLKTSLSRLNTLQITMEPSLKNSKITTTREDTDKEAYLQHHNSKRDKGAECITHTKNAKLWSWNKIDMYNL
jgi:hypothetical protein